jgi:hypothetical protein
LKKILITQQQGEETMTNPYKFKSVSLDTFTYQRLDKLTKNYVDGIELSKAKVVKELINEKYKERPESENTNDPVKEKDN